MEVKKENRHKFERNRTYQTAGKDDLSPAPKNFTEEQERDFIAKLKSVIEHIKTK